MMADQKLEAYLRESCDDYGHNRGGKHREYHEAVRDPDDPEDVRSGFQKSLNRYVDEDHDGYTARECEQCGQPFLCAHNSTARDCGGDHNRKEAL